MEAASESSQRVSFSGLQCKHVAHMVYSSIGGSHDRTDLLPLKAGVAIMALGAMVANPGLRVRIVPVGLSYFHAHKFRSRAVVEFGSPIDVTDELVDLFKKGGEEKRQASGKLLDIVYDGLKTVTIRTPDYETLMVLTLLLPMAPIADFNPRTSLFKPQGGYIRRLGNI